MTPQQKLVRLAELLNQFPIPPEAAGIIADVHLPPPELMNLPNDPSAWAKHMAATVAGVTEETALAWLMAAMSAAAAWAHAQGKLEEHVALREQAAEGHRALVDALRLVLDLIERRHIRPPMVRDSADPDNPPIPLAEYLQSVMRAAGEDVG